VVAFAPWTGGLEASGSEVQSIGEVYGERAVVFYGAAATEDRFLVEVKDHDIVHLATMGVLNRVNPLYSHVALRSGGHEDGRLETREVFGLSLPGSLVVLSACETGLSSGALADVPPGDEWVGFVRAFLQAGASAVIASLWQVDDQATERLMVDFYDRLASGSRPVDALAGAQRMMIHDPDTAEPYLWAAFELTGSP
jgi:CHAT domain-containing protein